jgi:NAD(P) transhydrogenase subunit alpha
MNGWILLVVFGLSTLTGYKLLREVPSLLHTPLMSGMNALSGITVLGALLVLAHAARSGRQALAAAAIVLAAVNVVGGFVVTGRMLRMFSRKEAGE